MFPGDDDVRPASHRLPPPECGWVHVPDRIPASVAAVVHLAAAALQGRWSRSRTAKMQRRLFETAYDPILDCCWHDANSLADAAAAVALVLGVGRGEVSGDVLHADRDLDRGRGAGSGLALSFLACSCPNSPRWVKGSILQGRAVAIGIVVGESIDDVGRYAAGRLGRPEVSPADPTGAVMIVDGWDAAVGAWSVRHPTDACFGSCGEGWLPSEWIGHPTAVVECVSVSQVRVIEE